MRGLIHSDAAVVCFASLRCIQFILLKSMNRGVKRECSVQQLHVFINYTHIEKLLSASLHSSRWDGVFRARELPSHISRNREFSLQFLNWV